MHYFGNLLKMIIETSYRPEANTTNAIVSYSNLYITQQDTILPMKRFH